MLDYITPITQNHSYPTPKTPVNYLIDHKDDPLQKLDTPQFPTFGSEPKFKKKDQPKPVRPGGKNLELLKAVVQEDLNTSFRSDCDELDSANDNFDITSYVIGKDYERKTSVGRKTTSDDDDDKPEIKTGKKMYEIEESTSNKNDKKFVGANGNVSKFGVKRQYEKTDMDPEEKFVKKKQMDEEEDHIDVETVSEPSEMPVLEARDLTSLLEQFEASEAVNPRSTEEEAVIKPLFSSNKPLNPGKPSKNPEQTTTSNANNNNISKVKPSVTKPEPELVTPAVIKPKQLTPSKSVNKNIQDSLPIELIQKIKASGHKKSISVIPAMPSKKQRGAKQEPLTPKNFRNKLIKIPSNESIQADHDYCSVSPPTIPKNNIRRSSDESSERKRDSNKQIDDTALRIEQQIKNAINKQKNNDLLMKYQPTVKNANGQLMVSLLKTNRNNTVNVNTVNANDEQIKNIVIVNDLDDAKWSKKKKLNLEEYKRRRGDVINKSCDNSGANSPVSGACSPMQQIQPKEMNQEEKYRNHQQLLMKMASEILKTPAKSNKPFSEAKLEEFVPPEARKSELAQPTQKVEPPKPAEDFDIVTYVSIGVNTDLTQIEKRKDSKAASKVSKKETVSKNNKCEVEETPPKKAVDSVVDPKKITQIIQPILQNPAVKISSNSLITNITSTLLQNTPKASPKHSDTKKAVQKVSPIVSPKCDSAANEQQEHGEDKTVQVLEKNRKMPEMVSVEIQTDEIVEELKEKPARQYRNRRDSSTSSSGSSSSAKCKNGSSKSRESRRQR